SVEISEGKPDEIEYEKYDYIFKSPGIRLKYPTREGFMADIDKSDIQVAGFPKITSQSEVFLEAFRDRSIGITGTKGKSTTTSMMHHVLEKCFAGTGRTAYLMGNIGFPCLDYYDRMGESDDIAVFEFSCHQLAYTDISPRIGVFLNLFEDHLDFYGDRKTYFQAKKHITDFQTENDILFIGPEVPELTTKAKLVLFSGQYDSSNMQLIGEHNRNNAGFVMKVATEVFGLNEPDVRKAIDEFGGLAHRLELFGEIDGVRYYDDSISTIPEATIQAVKAIPKVGTVLVGGMDREIDYTPLIEFIPQKKDVLFILMYASGKRIYDELMGGNNSETIDNIIYVDDLEKAAKIGREKTEKGKACVLSPAAASYGYFKNFEERGDVFKSLIKKNGG
ncbi:MAG: UDP-N-acetylmuramoyl-L-alanine--D-glutamate ligase, partial [Eubacterium sp.]|nr:UDP-N-acetylmuramoyl-L-alanine--D-glutamate ligase [Eubacterium sp.]